MSDFSDLEGAVGQGNNTFKKKGISLVGRMIVTVLWIMFLLYLGQIVRWGTLMGSCKLGKY